MPSWPAIRPLILPNLPIANPKNAGKGLLKRRASGPNPLRLSDTRLFHLYRTCGAPLPAHPPEHLHPHAVPCPYALDDDHLLGVHRGPQVDGEGEDVEGEDDGDDPLDDSGGVVLVNAGAGTECDAERELDDNEEEF